MNTTCPNCQSEEYNFLTDSASGCQADASTEHPKNIMDFLF